MESSASPETLPARTESGPPSREHVFLDEIGDRLKEGEDKAKQDAADAEAARKAKIEADARAAAGATSPDAARAKALEEALRISEEARRRADAALERAPVGERQKEEPKELSAEELKKLYDENPLEAISYMLAKRDRVLEENLGRRIGGLAASTAQSARSSAERKYPDEFRVLRKEIDDFVATLPNASAALTTEKNWDDLVYYIRGQPGNYEKIIKDKDDRAKGQEAEEAQRRQREAAGAHTRSEIRSPAPTGDTGLDETERQIAETLGAAAGITDKKKAHDEYKRWRGVAK